MSEVCFVRRPPIHPSLTNPTARCVNCPAVIRECTKRCTDCARIVDGLCIAHVPCFPDVNPSIRRHGENLTKRPTERCADQNGAAARKRIIRPESGCLIFSSSECSISRSKSRIAPVGIGGEPGDIDEQERCVVGAYLPEGFILLRQRVDN